VAKEYYQRVTPFRTRSFRTGTARLDSKNRIVVAAASGRCYRRRPDSRGAVAGMRLAALLSQGEAMATRSLPERVGALEDAVSALQHLPQELAEFRTEVNARFEQIDARFEQIDARFEQIDARFEQIDARFEQIDTQFARIDTQFEQVHSQMRVLHEDLIERLKALGEGRQFDATPPRPRRTRRKP
jgi:phage shock protein A